MHVDFARTAKVGLFRRKCRSISKIFEIVRAQARDSIVRPRRVGQMTQ